MGSRFGVAALLVAGLAGAGAYNYQRNLAREEREAPRYYRGYSDADLAVLIEAHEQELRAVEGRSPETGSRGTPSRSGPLLGDQVQGFERAQARGRARREAAGRVAAEEGTLRELRRERDLRRGSGLATHLRRLLTI